MASLYKVGYIESLDYSQLPGFETLVKAKQEAVHEAFTIAYRGSLSLGIKVALGKAHESAKIALAEALKSPPAISNDIPPSIFAGLDNC